MPSFNVPVEAGGSSDDEGAGHPVTGRVFTSDDLFAGAVEITISHENALYRLRITRQGKLVLNK